MIEVSGRVANKSEAHRLLAIIGRENLRKRLGLEGLTAISNYAIEGQFPANWYRAIKDLADLEGIDVPDHLIKWRLAEEPGEDGPKPAADNNPS